LSQIKLPCDHHELSSLEYQLLLFCCEAPLLAYLPRSDHANLIFVFDILRDLSLQRKQQLIWRSFYASLRPYITAPNIRNCRVSTFDLILVQQSLHQSVARFFHKYYSRYSKSKFAIILPILQQYHWNNTASLDEDCAIMKYKIAISTSMDDSIKQRASITASNADADCIEVALSERDGCRLQVIRSFYDDDKGLRKILQLFDEKQRAESCLLDYKRLRFVNAVSSSSGRSLLDTLPEIFYHDVIEYRHWILLQRVVKDKANNRSDRTDLVVIGISKTHETMVMFEMPVQ